jgi:hypothetical protein
MLSSQVLPLNYRAIRLLNSFNNLQHIELLRTTNMIFGREGYSINKSLRNKDRITHVLSSNKARVSLFLDVTSNFDIVLTTGLIAKCIAPKISASSNTYDSKLSSNSTSFCNAWILSFKPTTHSTSSDSG